VGLTTNGVRLTGDPCAHGEDQAIRKFHEDAVTALQKNKGAKLILFSSAEPCPNCRAKIEMFARHLVIQHLIKAGDFFTYYGATYQDTQDIAGFLDAAYFEEFKRPADQRTLRITRKNISDLDQALQSLIKEQGTSQPFCVLASKQNRLVSTQKDVELKWLDTPETTAVRALGAAQLKAGSATPWNMDGSTLYTAQTDIGPMLYATALWANVGAIVCLDVGTPQTTEMNGIPNPLFFEIISAPYDDPRNIAKIKGCDSVRPKLKAQRLWRDLLASGTLPPTALYNGVKI
jgi:hypothetical protein